MKEGASQWVKNPSVMQESWVQSLGGEDPLEEGMTAHSNVLAWIIPWTEESSGLQFMGLKVSGHESMHLFCDRPYLLAS